MVVEGPIMTECNGTPVIDETIRPGYLQVSCPDCGMSYFVPKL